MVGSNDKNIGWRKKVLKKKANKTRSPVNAGTTADKKALRRDPPFKIRYKNEHLRAQVLENAAGMRILAAVGLFGLFLCFMSFYNTYKDLYEKREIRFTDMLGLMDDTVYTVEITERPEELYPSYYMVKMGDNALFVTYISDDLKRLDETGYVKVRGVLRKFPENKQDIADTAQRYFTENHYYDDNIKLKERASTHYLAAVTPPFGEKLTEDHPLGLVFGLTILFVNALCIHWTGTLNVIRHLRPACGSVRYTPEEIDEQAELPDSEWLPLSGMYVTPKLLIGTQKGMAAVEYGDVKKAYIKPKWHTERKNKYASKHDKYKDYYTYQLVIWTKNHRKLIMCDSRSIEDSIKEMIGERCGVKVTEKPKF